MVSFTPNRAAIIRVINSDAVRFGLRRYAEELLELAKEECPVDSGDLRASGKIEIENNGYAVVFDKEYAIFVHDGTRAHTINAKRGSVLSWVDSSGRHFAARVQHPGTTADPWLLRAVARLAARYGVTG